MLNLIFLDALLLRLISLADSESPGGRAISSEETRAATADICDSIISETTDIIIIKPFIILSAHVSNSQKKEAKSINEIHAKSDQKRLFDNFISHRCQSSHAVAADFSIMPETAFFISLPPFQRIRQKDTLK